MSVRDFKAFMITPEGEEANADIKCTTSTILAAHGRGIGGFGVPAASRTALVVDGECCMDRLYGGFFSDWSCGGQWGHMLDFVATLLTTLHRSNVQLAIFFNGALEAERFPEWRKAQLQVKANAKKVLRHVDKRATPPPKAWWVPPTAIKTLLKYALRTLNATVISSVDDHRQELMAFCWENGYHGLMADDPEFAMFSPPRLLSATALKMTFQYDVSTMEFRLDDVAQALDLNPNRFCLLGALLGNHILPGKELKEFHLNLVPEAKEQKVKLTPERTVRAIVTYIRALPKVDDFEVLGKDVFGSATDPRVHQLKRSLAYYQNFSEEGYKARAAKEMQRNQHHPNQKGKKKRGPGIQMISEAEKKEEAARKKREKIAQQAARAAAAASGRNDSSSSVGKSDNDLVERIALDLDQLDINDAISAAAKVMEETATSNEQQRRASASILDVPEDEDCVGEDDDEDEDEEEEAEEGNLSVLEKVASGVEVEASEEGKYPTKKTPEDEPPKSIQIPDIHSDILKTSSERHRQSQMSPFVNQLLTRGEIKLPVLLEDEKQKELPLLHHLYQPLRQSVYALLFNLHHQNYKKKEAEDLARSHRRKSEELRKQAKKATSEEEKKNLTVKAEQLMKQASEVKIPEEAEIRIREWLPYNNYDAPEVVSPLDLNWATPTLQRLWFGSSLEDGGRRIRAFLTCLRSDSAPSLLNTAQVPQHFLLLACVLRYIMAAPGQNVILRKPELDAILATAFSPELRNLKFLDGLKMNKLTPRGILLGTLVMQGVEMAIFANDACGAPIPVQMCLPWTFFDGKLFQTKLKKAESSRNLLELCDGRMEIVYAIERMRAAILQGLVPGAGMNVACPGVLPMQIRGALGAGGQPHPAMMARGGQLVVGGAVVGNWGANYGSHGMNMQRMQQGKGKQQKKKKKNKNKAKVTSDAAEDGVALEPGQVRVMSKGDGAASEEDAGGEDQQQQDSGEEGDFRPRRKLPVMTEID